MTNIAEADDIQGYIAETLEAYPIVLFMKGTPSHPQCGFSAAIVRVLRHYNVPLHTVDVLLDPALRQGIKTYSDWPTTPQLYVHGTFVGGCDIVLEMHETGELEKLLAARDLGGRP